MAVQTSVKINHEPLHLGQVADGRLLDTMSGLAVNDIPFGAGVVRDGDLKAKLPTQAGDGADFLGVAMYELNRATKDGQISVLPANYDFTIVTFGDVCVEVKESVAVGDPVFCIHGASGRGKFRKDDTSAFQCVGWEFKKAVTYSADGSNLAVIGRTSAVQIPAGS